MYSVRAVVLVFCGQFVWAIGVASERVSLRFQASRSFGAEVLKNTCAQAENLSKGTRLKTQAKFPCVLKRIGSWGAKRKPVAIA